MKNKKTNKVVVQLFNSADLPKHLPKTKKNNSRENLKILGDVGKEIEKVFFPPTE